MQSDMEMLDIKESVNALISNSESSSEDFDNKAAYSYFEITLTSVVNIINKFVLIDYSEIAYRTFEEMRKLIGQFETLKKSFYKNVQTS